MLLTDTGDQVFTVFGETQVVHKSPDSDREERSQRQELLAALPQPDEAVRRAAGHQVRIGQGGQRRNPVSGAGHRLAVRVPHDHDRPLLHHAPEAEGAVVGARDHVFLVDEADAVDGAAVAVVDQLRLLDNFPNTNLAARKGSNDEIATERWLSAAFLKNLWVTEPLAHLNNKLHTPSRRKSTINI